MYIAQNSNTNFVIFFQTRTAKYKWVIRYRGVVYMKITKPIATAMVIFMLMPLLMSCSSPFSRQSTVVKADDPWYESTMFKIDKQVRANETLEDTCLCTSDEKIFSLFLHIYSVGREHALLAYGKIVTHGIYLLNKDILPLLLLSIRIRRILVFFVLCLMHLLNAVFNIKTIVK